MIFKKIKKKISDRHEVIKLSDEGNVVYKVKYIQSFEISEYFFRLLLKTYIIEDEQTSSLVFNNQELAELYAKNTYKCDQKLKQYSQNLIIYINDAKKFENYGYFTIWQTGKQYYYIHNLINFNFYDTDKFGNAINCCKIEDNFFENINQYIKQIENHINKIDFEPVVVSCFDAITSEVIPYDKIKASTEELQQLNELLEQYRKDQKAYQEFLQKLLK
ncbi:MAG: hypothetical protein [Wendovervirus sonii]|uniref:Uncharacterized protein n=1 Tax=phage Lak_Megaphage_Sonny TaxID=3109229 RepID=A0ABZ0Z2N3_9CAUD|nr:MAG: hypothetical protein [phage Lak_Megaphage_Sonny]